MIIIKKVTVKCGYLILTDLHDNVVGKFAIPSEMVAYPIKLAGFITRILDVVQKGDSE